MEFQTGYVRRERRYCNAAFQGADEIDQRFAYRQFGTGLAGHQSVGGIADRCQDAFVAKFLQGVAVGGLADQGVGIEFPIAGMHHHTQRRADRQHIGLGDRMSDGDEFDVEGTELQFTMQRNRVDPHAFLQARLFQLACDQPRGERRRINRAAQGRPQVMNGADVIFMRVGGDDAEHILAPFGKEGNVGHDNVDARRHRLFPKQHTAIDHNPFALVGRPETIGVEIHADLARPAKREQDQLVVAGV